MIAEAASTSVRLSRSLQPFCWGVYGMARRWRTPLSCSIAGTSELSNSPPSSLKKLSHCMTSSFTFCKHPFQFLCNFRFFSHKIYKTKTIVIVLEQNKVSVVWEWMTEWTTNVSMNNLTWLCCSDSGSKLLSMCLAINTAFTKFAVNINVNVKFSLKNRLHMSYFDVPFFHDTTEANFHCWLHSLQHISFCNQLKQSTIWLSSANKHFLVIHNQITNLWRWDKMTILVFILGSKYWKQVSL